MPVKTRELAGELQEWGVLVGLAMVLVGGGKAAWRGVRQGGCVCWGFGGLE